MASSSAVVVMFEQQRWELSRGQSVTIGRSRACEVHLPDDDHLSRRAAALTVLEDCLLIRNESTSKPFVVRPPAGEDRVVEPGAATTSLPWSRFALVFAGEGGAPVAIEIDAGELTPQRSPAAGVVTRARHTVTAPVPLAPAQRRVLLALCEPLLTQTGPAAVPATYTQIGARLGLQPQYVRNVVKSLRENLSGHGIPGLTLEDPGVPHDDFRWALARSAIRNGWVDGADLAELGVAGKGGQ